MPMGEMVEGLEPDLDKKLAKEIFGIPSMSPEAVEGKDKMVIWYENLMSVIDSLVSCKFNSVWNLGLQGGLNFEDYAELLTAATGIEYDAQRLMEIGERIYRLEIAYNAREGLRREDFKIPPRFVKDEIPDGPSKGAKVDLKTVDKLLDSYFVLRGVDSQTAIPTRKGLEEVDLKSIADDLETHHLISK
jgi:aldehyde:ferredoxin oxidoreductase